MKKSILLLSIFFVLQLAVKPLKSLGDEIDLDFDNTLRTLIKMSETSSEADLKERIAKKLETLDKDFLEGEVDENNQKIKELAAERGNAQKNNNEAQVNELTKKINELERFSKIILNVLKKEGTVGETRKNVTKQIIESLKGLEQPKVQKKGISSKLNFKKFKIEETIRQLKNIPEKDLKDEISKKLDSLEKKFLEFQKKQCNEEAEKLLTEIEKAKKENNQNKVDALITRKNELEDIARIISLTLRKKNSPKMASMLDDMIRKIIENLKPKKPKVKEKKEEEPEICPICREKFIDNGITACENKHKYHLGCLKEIKQCPICREKILPKVATKYKKEKSVIDLCLAEKIGLANIMKKIHKHSFWNLLNLKHLYLLFGEKNIKNNLDSKVFKKAAELLLEKLKPSHPQYLLNVIENHINQKKISPEEMKKALEYTRTNKHHDLCLFLFKIITNQEKSIFSLQDILNTLQEVKAYDNYYQKALLEYIKKFHMKTSEQDKKILKQTILLLLMSKIYNIENIQLLCDIVEKQKIEIPHYLLKIVTKKFHNQFFKKISELSLKVKRSYGNVPLWRGIKNYNKKIKQKKNEFEQIFQQNLNFYKIFIENFKVKFSDETIQKIIKKAKEHEFNIELLRKLLEEHKQSEEENKERSSAINTLTTMKKNKNDRTFENLKKVMNKLNMPTTIRSKIEALAKDDTTVKKKWKLFGLKKGIQSIIESYITSQDKIKDAFQLFCEMDKKKT